MRSIVSVVKRLIQGDIPKYPSGRWGREVNDAQRSYRVDWTNEDHCGPCGNNDLRKVMQDMEKKQKEHLTGDASSSSS
jgi:hypothetical protein